MRQIYDWLVARIAIMGKLAVVEIHQEKAEWRFVSMEYGALFVALAGIKQMLRLFVGN